MTVPDAGTYAIDPSQSVVEFVVRHLGLAKVRGRFAEFEGGVEITEDLEQSSAWAVIQASSIDTRDRNRDEYLRGADFLDVEHHPTLDFRTTGVRRQRSRWEMDGDLTIRGTTRPVTLHVKLEGGAGDPRRGARVGFSATTELNREDFGLTWNQALEAGGWLVGKQVKIELSVEAIKQ